MSYDSVQRSLQHLHHVYHYHQQQQQLHAQSRSSFSSIYYCNNDTVSRALVPSIAQSVASKDKSMSNAKVKAHIRSAEKRESITDCYNQYQVPNPNILNDDNLNSLLIVERDKMKRRTNILTACTILADARNACGGAQARVRLIKIRNEDKTT